MLEQTDNDLILLVAINARYSHCSLAVRSLIANMGALHSALVECEIKQSPEHIAETIIARNPVIVALGVYIWNRSIVESLVPLLRARLPDTSIVLGGPEISYDVESDLAHAADCVICGEAEHVLPDICESLLAGHSVAHVRYANELDLADLLTPFHMYSDNDLAHRNVYIETSRGCPCKCRFCLSSLGCGVRYYPLEKVFAGLDQLLARGARRFRFVDRSFNLAGDRSVQILAYFLDKNLADLFLHLEIVPEFLSPALRDVILQFPPGCLHIETGIQSLSVDVLRRINRPAKPEAALEGIHWLTHVARATVHADLIAGLPGETLTSFIAGFERLQQAGPAEIQLGILKHLPGTDLHVEPGMRFSSEPPYAVIASDAMTRDEIDSVERFAAHWERVVNRGLFPAAMEILQQGPHLWHTFDAFSRELEAQHGRHGIGLVELARALHAFLHRTGTAPEETIRAALADDYLAGGRRSNLPAFLRPTAS